MRRCLFILLCALLLAPSAAHAWDRSSSSVSPDSPFYRDLDKLVAFSICEPPIRGQRPYMRSEFARMIAEAMRTLEAREAQEGRADSLAQFAARSDRRRQIAISMERLQREFHDELVDRGALPGERMRYRLHPLEKAWIEARYLDSPPTQIIPNNGRGTINAQVNPLGDYRLGRHPVDGYVNAVEPVARFQVGKFFSAYVRPRFEADIPRTAGDMQGHAYLQNGYGTFRAGNFAIKVGRDSMVWGFGERGSLLYSTNPRPFDGVWITNPTPARLPWIFKYLGRWRYTLYGMNFGPGFSRKWAWLAGYKLGLAPARYVEIGFGHSVMMGGEGAPGLSGVDVIGEFFGFRPAGTNSSAPNLTNHLFEVELLVRIPQLRGVELYGNAGIDDKWKSITKTLEHGMFYLAGLYLPALNRSGTVDLRLEYEHLNPLQYRHGLYSDGYTINRRLIGSDAGPDADTAHVRLRHTLGPTLWYGITLGWDFRRSDLYRELSTPSKPVVQIASGPSEARYRGMLDVDWTLRRDLELRFTGGYERVTNLHYQEGVDRNNFIVAAGLKIDLDRYFGFEAN